VAVYSVDKTELSLTRNDLIEFINVRILLSYSIHSRDYLCLHLLSVQSMYMVIVCPIHVHGIGQTK